MFILCFNNSSYFWALYAFAIPVLEKNFFYCFEELFIQAGTSLFRENRILRFFLLQVYKENINFHICEIFYDCQKFMIILIFWKKIRLSF